MKNAATAIHITRQKTTRAQRSKYFWRDLFVCPEAIRSWLSSFISCSAWFFITIAGKPLFDYREFRSDLDGLRNNFRETESFSFGFPRLQARLHYTESCPEWEHYTFYLVQSWKTLRNYLLQLMEITRKSLNNVKLRAHQLAMAVR